jgi:hypothetical protein
MDDEVTSCWLGRSWTISLLLLLQGRTRPMPLSPQAAASSTAKRTAIRRKHLPEYPGNLGKPLV